MMNTRLAANHDDRRPALDEPGLIPRDLREQLGETTLVRLVLDAVVALDFFPAKRPATFRNPEGIEPLPLLSLVTYAYATGRRSSDEIEEAARHDRGLAYLAAGQLPSSPTIRRFRRAFSPAITRALWQVLRRVANRVSNASPEPPGRADANLLREARRRVDAAVLADTMALDY